MKIACELFTRFAIYCIMMANETERLDHKNQERYKRELRRATMPKATAKNTAFIGQGVNRYVFHTPLEAPKDIPGGLFLIRKLALDLAGIKDTESNSLEFTEKLEEYWNEQKLLSRQIKGKDASNPRSDAEFFVFWNYIPDNMPEGSTGQKKLVFLRDVMFSQYTEKLDEHTMLITDAQTFAKNGVNLPPAPYDYERQVTICRADLLKLLSKGGVLHRLQALVVFLSTASAFILERDGDEWKGLFIYLPNLYTAAYSPLEILNKHPRAHEAAMALLTADWLCHDCESDHFNLLHIARYRLSLAVHDALMLYSALLDPQKAGGKNIPPREEEWPISLEKIDTVEYSTLLNELKTIRNADTAWHHPIHVPVEIVESSSGQPWRMLASLQLDGFTLARRIMEKGIDGIRGIPLLKRGDLETFDTTEVLGALRVEQRIVEYLSNTNKKPLNIAVFGPPGSGKSFFVDEIVKGINDRSNSSGRQKIHSFTLNLSQIPSAQALSALTAAFHTIRSIEVHGEMPLLFVDEFDTGDFQWIQYFLAPMNDAQFLEGNMMHRLPRCIMLFAGGVATTFEKLSEVTRYKVPDFVSRLHGTLDTRGINPDSENDPNNMYIARRAILLQKELQKRFSIDNRFEEGLQYALLHVAEYKGGARAIRKLLAAMTDPITDLIHRECLPSDDELNQHLDVLSFKDQYEFGVKLYACAQNACPQVNEKYHELQGKHFHECEGKYLTQDYDGRNEENDRRILPGNRDGTLHLPNFLMQNGYRVSVGKGESDSLTDEASQALACFEHTRWMAIRMMDGAWFDTFKPTKTVPGADSDSNADIMKNSKRVLNKSPYFVDCETLQRMSLCSKKRKTIPHFGWIVRLLNFT